MFFNAVKFDPLDKIEGKPRRWERAGWFHRYPLYTREAACAAGYLCFTFISAARNKIPSSLIVLDERANYTARPGPRRVSAYPAWLLAYATIHERYPERTTDVPAGVRLQCLIKILGVYGPTVALRSPSDLKEASTPVDLSVALARYRALVEEGPDAGGVGP